MTETLAALAVDLRTNTQKFVDGIDKANKKLGGLSNQLSKAGRAFRGFTGILAGGLSAKFIKDIIDTGDKLQKLNLRLGTSVSALSQYEHVANLSGVTFQQLTIGWQRQTRRLAEAASGIGEARNALKELNLDAKELVNLAPEDQFEVIADRLSKVANQSDRVRLAMKFWDSEGVSLLQVAGQGADEIKRMRKEADELGLTISQKTANEMAAFNDLLTILQGSVVGVGRSMVSALIRPVTRGVLLLAHGMRQLQQDWHDFTESISGGDSVGARARALESQITDLMEHITHNMQRVTQIGEQDFLNFLAVRLTAQSTAAAERLAVLREEFDKLGDSAKEGAIKMGPVEAQTRKLLEELDKVTTSANKAGISLTNLNKTDPEITRQTEAAKELASAYLAIQDPIEKFNVQLLAQAKLFNEGWIGAEEYTRRIKELQEGLVKNTQTQANEWLGIWQNTLNSFAQGVGQTVADVVFEQKSLADGAKELTRGVLKEMLSAFVQIGVKKLALYALDKINIQTNKTAAVAAQHEIAAASAPAAAGTTLSTLGANVPIALAGLAAVYALSSSLSGQFHDGTSFVKRTGSYYIQEGERVLSRNDNRTLMKAIGEGSVGGETVIKNYFDVSTIDAESTAKFVDRNKNLFAGAVLKVANERGRRPF